MENNGHITIRENDRRQFVVDATLINGNLWLSKYQMTDLFNTYASTAESNLRAIFKSGILREKDVSHSHSFEHKGRICQMTLYSLEAVIFISYRVPSFESRAFRGWIMKSLCKLPFTVSLN
jgi:hypothetical protein